jgi:hypothetical protein
MKSSIFIFAQLMSIFTVFSSICLADGNTPTLDGQWNVPFKTSMGLA